MYAREYKNTRRMKTNEKLLYVLAIIVKHFRAIFIL